MHEAVLAVLPNEMRDFISIDEAAASLEAIEKSKLFEFFGRLSQSMFNVLKHGVQRAHERRVTNIADVWGARAS